MKMALYRKYFSLFLLLFCYASQVRSQGIQTEFGKNVIQYRDFEWSFYRTDNFDVYFYQGGKELARYVMAKAEEDLKDIETKIDYPLGDRMTFIIYTSYTDYRQSNFQLTDEQYNIGGKTHVSDNKAFIYFDGSHFNLAGQVRSGIAQVILQDILYGGSLQEKLQNNVLLNLPSWYSEGLIEYIGQEWSPEYENQLRNGILSGRYKQFRKLSEQEATLVGHSLWKYIYDQYGKDALANVIYIMRANKSIESGYLFVLGKDFTQLFDEWYQYHYNRFKSMNAGDPDGLKEEKLKKVFKKGTLTRWAISGKGDYAAAVTNDQGKIKVWVVDLATGKKKKIYKKGYKRGGIISDYNYPLIDWNPRQNILTVIYEDKVTPTYFHYNVDEKKKSDRQIIPRIDRILSFDYSDNGRTSVMSVVRKGQTDIFTFDFRSQAQRPLTDDIYDDLDPRFVHGGKGVVFSSNRPDNSLARINSTYEYTFSNNWDIFYFPDAEIKSLKRLSTGLSNETMPDAYDTSYFSYLTDANGIVNRNAVYLDSIFQHIRVVASYSDTSIRKNDTLYFYQNDMSVVNVPDSITGDSLLTSIDTAKIYRDTLYVYPLTDYNENIQSYDINQKTGMLYELFYADNAYTLYKKPIPANIPSRAIRRGGGNSGYLRRSPPKSDRTEVQKIDVFSNNIVVQPQPVPADTQRKTKAYFQSDFPVPDNKAQAGNVQGQSATSNIATKNGRQRYGSSSLYFLSFTPDYLVTQLDNSVINSPYLPYTGDDGRIYNPVINGMIKLGTSDLFKDYRFIGGFRIMASLRGAEYFMTFENLKHRLDKRLIFYRRGEIKDDNLTTFYRTTSNELRTELRWPFSEVTSLRMSGFGRLDKTVYLSGERKSLERATEPTYWGGGKLEFVLDNTIPRGMNLYNGTRLKLYSEFFNAFNKEKTLFTVIGADMRHYMKISRHVIWANRLATATSIGPAKVVYIMGGVDNWLFPQYNDKNVIDPEVNYVYKTQATQMRGFSQNVRNGNAYAVLNSELRVPIFKTIFNKPFRNQFFENFQVVGFTDVGSAWRGLNPFSEENAYNKRVISQGPFKATVISLRDPIVYGYGFGFRSVILGYFVKLDYSWGVEDKTKQPRMTYFSLGLDF